MIKNLLFLGTILIVKIIINLNGKKSANFYSLTDRIWSTICDESKLKNKKNQCKTMAEI